MMTMQGSSERVGGVWCRAGRAQVWAWVGVRFCAGGRGPGPRNLQGEPMSSARVSLAGVWRGLLLPCWAATSGWRSGPTTAAVRVRRRRPRRWSSGLRSRSGGCCGRRASSVWPGPMSRATSMSTGTSMLPWPPCAGHWLMMLSAVHGRGSLLPVWWAGPVVCGGRPSLPRRRFGCMGGGTVVPGTPRRLPTTTTCPGAFTGCCLVPR